MMIAMKVIFEVVVMIAIVLTMMMIAGEKSILKSKLNWCIFNTWGFWIKHHSFCLLGAVAKSVVIQQRFHTMKESHEPVTRWPRVREILTRLSGNLGSVVPWLLAANSLKRTNLCPRHWLLRPITWKRWRPDLCYRRWPLLVNNTTRDDQACVPDIDPTIVGR